MKHFSVIYNLLEFIILALVGAMKHNLKSEWLIFKRHKR
jgi:hypothetical protein